MNRYTTQDELFGYSMSSYSYVGIAKATRVVFALPQNVLDNPGIEASKSR